MHPLKIAIAHMAISSDIRKNSQTIQKLINEAVAEGCGLVQFPEGSLSGYIKTEITDISKVDWVTLEDELDAIKTLARKQKIWVVVGSLYRLPSSRPPHNSLYVISSEGKIGARYDKRILSHTESNGWYTAGKKPVVFEVEGIKIGLALCIEIQFYEVFSEYRQLGVDIVLLSAYSEDPMFAITARAHASLNTIWVGLSTPVTAKNALPSSLFSPDGSVLAHASSDQEGLAIATIDLTDSRWEVPLKKARPWREATRKSLLR